MMCAFVSDVVFAGFGPSTGLFALKISEVRSFTPVNFTEKTEPDYQLQNRNAKSARWQRISAMPKKFPANKLFLLVEEYFCK